MSQIQLGKHHIPVINKEVTQPKVPRSAQICIFGGGGRLVFQTNSTQSAKICQNLHWGVGGGVQTNIPEILEWGTQGILNQNFQPLELASA